MGDENARSRLDGGQRALVEAVLCRLWEWRERLGKPALDPALDSRVLAALARTPRRAFVERHLVDLAHLDRPLEIGHGQTISQPTVVAIMTDLLRPRPWHRVLEIGTGCGYQTAILASLVGGVYSVEVIPDLAVDAIRRFRRLRLANVAVRVGDGAEGWAKHGPYDGIIVTAAFERVPRALLDQVKPGGRLVAPVGPAHGGGQSLMVVRKGGDGAVSEEPIMPVRFVPIRSPEPEPRRAPFRPR